MKAQIGLEILSIVTVLIAALTITAVFTDTSAREQKMLTEAQALVKTLSNAVELVSITGEGSQQLVLVYVPENVNESRTFANNGTLNYGMQLSSGTTDIFDFYNSCVAGELPTLPGYYNILVYYEAGCAYLDYNITINPLFDCWGVNGECDNACLYSDFGNTSYYTNPGCSNNCLVAGEFYAPTISCDPLGTGDCYKFTSPASRSTACTIGESCGGSCTGTPTICSLSNNCTLCGCTNTSGGYTGADVWSEDFSSNSDWAVWTGNGAGIAYVNAAANCVNDANDDCLNGDGGSSNYYLYKQSSVDLSTCELGSAWFYIAHVREGGTLEGNDCIYVAFSNNGGGSWGGDNNIFCNDNPSATYNITIPNSYLTNDFRVRIHKAGFTDGGEEVWLDNLKVHCKLPTPAACTGSPNPCASHTNQSSCEACGCNWNTTLWNWNLSGNVIGYDNFTKCEFINNGCWGKDGSCNINCEYASFNTTNYYDNPGCSTNCPVSGSFYLPNDYCSNDGAGNCYIMSDALVKGTNCTLSNACAGNCTGSPSACSILDYGGVCLSCGCSQITGGGFDKWSEDFSSNSDWAVWTGNGAGIAYVNDATNCVNDANDDCLNGDGGSSNYYLYKQSSVDLSTCELGSAWFYIAHVREGGNIESNDCVYVAFSNDGGSNWGSDNTIFCNDNPSATYNITIPNSYLTNDFRVRIRKAGFTDSNEEAWLDNLLVHCKQPYTCTGSPSSCNIYSSQGTCNTCGCNWNSTSWNWVTGGASLGYQSYDSCEWYE